MCRRERAAEKSLQRANSSGAAPTSTTSTAPPRLNRAMSSGAGETAAAAAAAAAAAPSVTVKLAPTRVLVAQGGSPRGDRGSNNSGSSSGSSSRSGGRTGSGSGSLDVEGDGRHALPLDEKQQQSIIEAREAAEAGAGLVKVCVRVCIFGGERGLRQQSPLRKGSLLRYCC